MRCLKYNKPQKEVVAVNEYKIRELIKQNKGIITAKEVTDNKID